jgi:hypothetical protein
MQRKALVLGVVAGLITLAGVFVWLSGSDAWGLRKGAAKVASFRRLPTHELTKVMPKSARELDDLVDDLLADGSHPAWEKIATLYRAANDDTKRAIVRHACEVADLKRALAYVLATVGDDFTPLEEDRMIDEAAGFLKERWGKPEDLGYGREQMLLQKSEKRKWVLAKAMMTFAADLPADPSFRQQKTKLSAKLIDFHASTSSGFIRAEIAGGLNDMGATDVALLLTKGTSAPLEEMKIVKAEKAAQQKAFDELKREAP